MEWSYRFLKIKRSTITTTTIVIIPRCGWLVAPLGVYMWQYRLFSVTRAAIYSLRTMCHAAIVVQVWCCLRKKTGGMHSGEQEWHTGKFSCTGKLHGGNGFFSAMSTMCVLASLRSRLLDHHHHHHRHFTQATIIVLLFVFLFIQSPVGWSVGSCAGS